MGREGIEVQVQAIAGEQGEASRGQSLSERVDEPMGHGLGAGAELEHGQNLGARIESQPQPEHLTGTAQPCANFIQLQMREVQVAEGVLMEALSVLACARKPPRDGGLTGAEDPLGSGRVQSFGQGRQDHGDLLRGGFQTVEGRVAPASERGTAGLTPKRLDPLETAMLAVADQSVDVSFRVPEVRALGVGTSEPFGVDAFWSSPPAFHLAPGANRTRSWPSTQRGKSSETTGGAIVRASGLQETMERRSLGRAL